MESPIVPLNLPMAKLNLSKVGEAIYVICLIRKKKILLTPEEWVRQHIVNFLIEELKISVSLIAVEVSLSYNELKKRCDILVFSSEGKPKIIVECKAPEVNLSENVYHQIAVYNSQMNVKKMLISNGREHVVCVVEGGEIKYSDELVCLIHP